MSINLSVPSNNETPDLKPKISVIGIGGAGGNAVNNMIDSQLEGVDFVVANTDAQALKQSRAERRLQLGINVTHGLGAGSSPEMGRAAAEEALEEILESIGGSNMVFIAAGMGGGTGTGAAPVIAQAAKEKGVLTVAVVTKPFHFEGIHRMRIAEDGLKELEQYVDTLLIIPNQNLFRVANEKTTFADAFHMADEVLYSGVRGVTDLMVMPGLINLDFADIRTVMREMGKAMMGTGEADGERRALDAAEAAISNPLLDDTSMKGARGVLINITGGPDMTLFEVDEAANRVRAEVDDDAYIIFGSTFDEGLQGKLRVSVVATGMDTAAAVQPVHTVLNLVQEAPAAAAVTAPEGDEDGEDVAADGAAEGAGESAAEGGEEENPAPAADAPSGETAGTEAAAAATDETAEPPPAMPSSGARDPFIPPKPAFASGAGIRPSASAAGTPREADEEEGAADEPAAKIKRPSLFERVTGTGRARIGTAQPAAPEPPAAKPGDPAEGQKRLGALDPADRIRAVRPEEDLLDIPAFLRRQAN